MKYAGISMFMVFAVMAGMVICGCEGGDDDTTALIIEPTVYDFTTSTDTNGSNTASQTAVFTVSETNGGLRAYPLHLTWSVSDSTLGGISSSSGYTAVYTNSSLSGVNVIMVRDQYGAEGSATVRQ